MSGGRTLVETRTDDARLLGLFNDVRAGLGLAPLPPDFWSIVDRNYAEGLAAGREAAIIDLAAERRRRRNAPSATARLMGAS